MSGWEKIVARFTFWVLAWVSLRTKKHGWQETDYWLTRTYMALGWKIDGNDGACWSEYEEMFPDEFPEISDEVGAATDTPERESAP